jgi:hypothetical protein
MRAVQIRNTGGVAVPEDAMKGALDPQRWPWQTPPTYLSACMFPCLVEIPKGMHFLPYPHDI